MTTWIGVGGSPESVVRAARYDLPLMLAIIGGDARRFRPYVDLYRRACGAIRLRRRARSACIRRATSGAPTRRRAPISMPTSRRIRDRIGGERGWPPMQESEFDREIRARRALCRLAGDGRTKDRRDRARRSALDRFDLKYSAGGLSPREDDGLHRALRARGDPAGAGAVGVGLPLATAWVARRHPFTGRLPRPTTTGSLPRATLLIPATMTTHPIENIRNFSIVAHIDHGKSTLADRLIQTTGTLAERDMVEQVLDSMDIERERGITIKAQTVRLEYKAQDGKTYILNLMDTPGHVDFAYEVSRSLAACEGSLLVVDASQGVEAQTLANVYHALDAGHEIVPVLNKIDLPAAEPDRIKQQIEDVIGLDASEAVPISAKTGLNIDLVLEAIVKRLPPPKGDETAPLKALLVDSWYDAYLGVVVLVRVIDGVLKKGMRIHMMGADAIYDVERIGVFRPKMSETRRTRPRRGRLHHRADQAGRRHPRRRHHHRRQARRRATRCPASSRRSRWCSAACSRSTPPTSRLCAPRWARLRLNDASFSYEMETSAALGFGFRCGFLGLLHLEIIQERLEREFNLDLIATAPVGDLQDRPQRQDRDRAAQPVDMPDSGQDRLYQGAVDQGDDPDARRLSGRGAEALPGPARLADRSQLCRQARDGHL